MQRIPLQYPRNQYLNDQANENGNDSVLTVCLFTVRKYLSIPDG